MSEIHRHIDFSHVESNGVVSNNPMVFEIKSTVIIVPQPRGHGNHLPVLALQVPVTTVVDGPLRQCERPATTDMWDHDSGLFRVDLHAEESRSLRFRCGGPVLRPLSP